MALHSFIRDSSLNEKYFNKYDSNDEYLPPLLQKKEAPKQAGENEDTMNNIRTRRVDACFARGR